jgi:hypothetical protein
MAAVKGLEDQFHLEMLLIYEEAKEFGYYPARFLGLVHARGGLRAAKELLWKEGVSDGFIRLWKEDRLDISVEALVLRDPWNTLFTEEELNVARQRLSLRSD